MELDRSVVDSVNKANKKLGEFFYVLANEPSVGLYHVQEHIRKTIPKNTEMKREIRKKYQNIEAMTYDVNFSIQTVKSLHDLTTFATIKQTMESCIDMINSLNKGQQGRKITSTPIYTPISAPISVPISVPISTPKSTPTSTPISTPTRSQAISTNIKEAVAPPPQLKTDSPRAHSTSTDIASSESKVELTADASQTDRISDPSIYATEEPISDPNDKPENDSSNLSESSVNDNDEGLAHKKVKKTKKPKAAKNIAKNFDLTPKQF